MTDMTETEKFVVEWATKKGLIDGPKSSAQKQFIKLTEEVGELGREILHSDADKAKLELGDCLVVLNILASQLGSSAQECLDLAWQKIKDRKGKTENGVFIKEE